MQMKYVNLFLITCALSFGPAYIAAEMRMVDENEDAVERLSEEREEVYGDPSEEEMEYEEEIRKPDLDKDVDYYSEDHPLEEKPLPENPVR